MDDDDPESRWWNYGDYTGDDCPNCGRSRLMECQDNECRKRIICEKCDWEPEKDNYRAV